MHETHFALAPEGTRIVEALPVFAKRRVVRALVYVRATVAVPFEPRVANALERALGVDALRVLVASAVVCQTFVYVAAADPVACETVLTTTLVGALQTSISNS